MREGGADRVPVRRAEEGEGVDDHSLFVQHLRAGLEKGRDPKKSDQNESLSVSFGTFGKQDAQLMILRASHIINP